MMPNTKRIFVALVLVSLVAISFAGAADKWLHVRVEGYDDDERVNVNVPLSMVESMLPMIEMDELQNGKLRLGALDDDLQGLDLRGLAVALRDAPDADFVRVESADENVRVAKEGEFLIIVVEEHGRRSAESVRVRVPLAVVDALIGDDPDELDLLAALRVLSEYEDPLIDIESDEGTVRVWIDSSSSDTGR